MWALGDCATKTGHSAELNITRECDAYSCTFLATMRNTGYRLLLSPRVELLGFDCDGNTIDSYTVYYDEIFAGKKQSKRVTYNDDPMSFIIKSADWFVTRDRTYKFC